MEKEWRAHKCTQRPSAILKRRHTKSRKQTNLIKTCAAATGHNGAVI